jgi:integrase
MKLTHIQIKQAQPGIRPYKLSDGKGLYLLVNPNGSKWWRYKYRFSGKEKLKSIGVYPDVSLAEAREERDKLRKLILGGQDPVEKERKDKFEQKLKDGQTFELVAREWHTQRYDGWTSRHAANILTRLEADVFPVIGRKPISSLTPPIVLDCIRKIEDRGAHEMARRAMQMCSQVLRYGVATGRIERDVTTDLRGALKHFKRGHYNSIGSDELPQFLRLLEENKPRLFRQTVIATKLLMLTFVRTSELIEARWSEIDFDKEQWIIPAERMKMGKSHVVPLSRQAMELFKEQHERSKKSEYVFPSIPRPKKPMSNGTILGALKRLGYKGKMTGHGFRSLALTALKEKLGYAHEIADRQLAHVPSNRVDAAYDRAQFLSQRKVMMQDWADYIDKLGANY